MTTTPPQQVLPSHTTYLAFSDESYWNDGRFRSLALVTLCSMDVDNLKSELSQRLEKSKITEFKWAKIGDARYQNAAEAIIDFAFRYFDRKKLRVDVLVWDTMDSRHKIRYRDDAENLTRMYFHLIRRVLTNRWPDDSTWFLFPDEHSQIDWDTLRRCLEYRSIQWEPQPSPQPWWSEWQGLRELFDIQNLMQCNSQNEPFIQVADLFGGLAAYSYEHNDKFCSWRDDADLQLCLLPDLESPVERSKADERRCYILDYLDKKCKRRSLHVSLKSMGGLFSYNQNHSPNFWLYAPQHEADKAPTKSHRVQRGAQ